MEIHHLRYFITVAEELHFGRAALKLHIAQPPLSRHIKTLEKYLGVQLFYRDRRHVQLTAAGEAFLPTAREILRLIQIAAEETSRAIPAPQGAITLAVPTESSHVLIKEVLDGFAAEVPSVCVNRTLVAQDDLLVSLREGFVDLGLLYMSGCAADSLHEERLYDDTAVAVLWHGHRLAKRKSIRLRELSDEQWILHATAASQHDPWNGLKRQAEKAGFTLRVKRVVPTLQAALQLVDQKAGITVVPHVYNWFPHASMRFVPVDRSDVLIPLSMYTRKDDRQSITDALLHIARQTGLRRSVIGER